MDFYTYFVWLGLICLCKVTRGDDTWIHIAKVGDRVVLPCYNPSSTPIIWFKENDRISYGQTIMAAYRAKFEIDNRVATETNLVIKSVEHNDEATYFCKKLDRGSYVTLGERRLKVETKPEIDEHASSPHSLDVQEGDTITIWCNVSGTPEPEVKWQRYMGQNDPPIDIIGATGNELTLINVTMYASDTYVCHVANRHGSVTKGTTITVKFPVMAAVYQDEVTIDTGEVALLACMVQGEPIMEAYWKNTQGQKIPVGSNWDFEVEEENQPGRPQRLITLKIRALEFRLKYGYYTCYVSGDTSEYEARVLLKNSPPEDGHVINYQK